MKFRFFSPPLLAGLFAINALINVAFAGIITETYQANISSSTHSDLFAINDIVTWSVTYDDSSTTMHIYNDGVDGVAGTADDTLNTQYDATCPTGPFCNSHSLFADAKFDLSQLLSPIYQSIKANNEVARDVHTENKQWRFADKTSSSNNTTFEVDDVFFTTLQSDDYNGGSFNLSTALEFYSFAFNNITITDVSAPSSKIPEPTTLAIFALGMIGLASRRFKKQS